MLEGCSSNSSDTVKGRGRREVRGGNERERRKSKGRGLDITRTWSKGGGKRGRRGDASVRHAVWA